METSVLPAIPGFGWTTPARGKVELHPQSHEVPLGEFPGTAPQAMLDLIQLGQSEFSRHMMDALKQHGAKVPLFVEEANEFMRTGTSNGRRMKWHLMRIAPNTSFKLHAHPNIELIYVIRGTMNEVRLCGSLPKRVFDIEEKDGPPLSDSTLGLQFIRRSTSADGPEPVDRFLINEKGSIHLSYTMEDGAELLILWSGSHANIPLDQYPPNAAEVLALPTQVTPY